MRIKLDEADVARKEGGNSLCGGFLFLRSFRKCRKSRFVALLLQRARAVVRIVRALELLD